MTRSHLPRRVYLRHGRYFYVRPDGKWLPLSKERDGLAAMHASLARVLDTEIIGDLLPAVISRWLLQRVDDEVWSDKHREDMERVANEIAKEFDEITPHQVTAKLVSSYLKPLRAKKRTHNKHRTALRQVLDFAATEGLRDGANPVSAVPPVKQDKRTRIVTDAEVRALKGAAMLQSRNGEALVQMIDLAMLTGQRIGDLISMRWQDITPAGVIVTQSKTKARLLIEWSPALKAAVEACAQDRERIGYVLKTQTGTGFRYAGIHSAWRRACERAGIEDLNIHDLRGRAGVDALGDDEDMRAAQRLLGHATEGMTRHYVDGKFARRAKPSK